jgi:hypothetical protein
VVLVIKGLLRAGAYSILTGVLTVGVVISPIVAAESDPGWQTGGDSRACSAPRAFDKVSPQGPGIGREVLVIGDSVTRDSRAMLTRSLKSSGWNPTIRCFGGKRIDWGMAQLRDQRDWNGIPETVVIALGTNDMRWIDRAITQSRITKILDQLGPKRSVLWVNLYGGEGDRFSKSKQAWFNKTLSEIASKRPNVSVLPWARQAKSARIPMSGPLHYAHKGLVLRTQLTVDFLNEAFGEVLPPNSNTPTGLSCITCANPLDSYPKM